MENNPNEQAQPQVQTQPQPQPQVQPQVQPQPQYQQPAPVYVNKKDMPETPEDKQKANKLCIISLCCMFLPGLVTGILSFILYSVLNVSLKNDYNAVNNAYEAIFGLIYLVMGAAEIAAWVLMIYVRVKYPKNTLGKVLMILYIALVVISIILVVVLFITCIESLRSCS